ncbi:MAG: phospholipase D-like domain-containing protein [Bacteroidetes bacterium]|nr:phospholipase D-like domain-containing protein [Bacteroidota bacterium]
MKKVVLSILCLVILGIQGFSQANIAAARAMPEGSTVTIRGVITNGAELGIIRYLQDGTAGIAAYGAIVSGIERGDSVLVTGVTKNYNYLLELDPVNSIVAIAPKPSPAPIVITPGQLKEQYEAMLVKMVDVTFINAGGVFSGNTNYNVTANGETCQVRVNNASNLVGQIIPADQVTIVGLCSQFSFVSPTTGYQMLLRDKNDIISNSTIVFTTPLTVSNITTTSLSFGWNTNIAGTTELYYGLTPQLELGHLSNAGTGTTHTINVSGLNPSDLIYVQAFSVAAPDTGFSGLKTFITQSASTGNIKTYFTRPVDTTGAIGPKAIQIYRAVDDTCIAYINRAKQTIDIAIYNFNVEGISNIASALNAAYARGVKVRVVTDGGTNNSALPLLVAGIGKLGRPVTTGIMHNKFMVIDGQSSNPNDPIVWTGSCNWTDQNVNTDANNILFIQDASIAKVYTMEFTEMFGSTTTTPNLANAKFGPAKADNTPHELIIGGNRVEVYFSPSDGVNQQIVNHINTANSDLEVGTMLITRTLISNAIIARKNAGVASKVIISSRSTSDAVVVTDLKAALGNNFREYHEQGLLHSKAMIVDQSATTSDPFVWTGSHNWSDAANVSNDENSIVIHDAAMTNLFIQEFKYRFTNAIPLTEQPVLNLGPDQTVYGGDTVTLDAGQFTSYVWSTGEFGQIIKVDSSGVGYGVKKIYCRVTNEFGTQSDTVRITFKPLHPVLNLGPDQTVVAAYCRATDGSDSQSDTVLITFKRKLELGPDQTVVAAIAVTLDAGPFNTYLWSTGAVTRSIQVDSSGTGYGIKKVYCKVTDQYGTQSDTVSITFRPYQQGIGEQNNLVSKLSVYPNPTTGAFTVGFNAKRSEVISVELLSSDGKVVWHTQKTTQPGLNSIGVEQITVPSGIYLVRLRTSEGDLGRKLVVK